MLLAIVWGSLPVRLHRAGDNGSGARCLTLAEQPRSADRAAEIPLLERCVSEVSNDAELIADLGDAYAAGGRNAEAERAYRRALEIDQDFADVHLKLADQLLRKGDPASARPHVEAALRVQPNRRAAEELLAKVTAAK